MNIPNKMGGNYEQKDMVSFLQELNMNMRELNKQSRLKIARDNQNISLNIKNITQTIDG